MSAIKIFFNDEVRRISISEDTNSLQFQFLLGTIKSLFPKLRDQVFCVLWQDEEGDWISISSDAEYREAMRMMNSSPSKLLRFTVKAAENAEGSRKADASSNVKEIPSNAEHFHVTCDECHVTPIRGIRYKCTVRDDFDLCSKCESLRNQPFPMIKIYNPEHAPSNILFAFRDEHKKGRWGGCEGPWRRGMRPHGGPNAPHHPPFHHPPFHHPGSHPILPPREMNCPPHEDVHAHGPMHFPPPPFPSTCGVPPEVPPQVPPTCQKRAERCNKKSSVRCGAPWMGSDVANAATTLVSPFIAAMDAVKDKFVGESSRSQKDREDAEEQLLQEAIEESLHINESELKFKKPTPSFVETAVPAVNNLPKPALRFVKDVTFPDGTTVPPGTIFRKSWRVRNDGPNAWPEGVVLRSAGGDMMCSEEMRSQLPSLCANEEAEITVTLSAPEAPGLYTAYFRAQTAEEHNFGHRLWASILVNEESDWQVLSQHLQEVKNEQQSTDSVSDEPPAVDGESSSATASASVEVQENTESICAHADAGEPQTDVAPVRLDPIALLWRRELEILADMGFSNTADILPLLQKFLAVPVSLSGDRSAAPSVDGMQRVVSTLLTAATV